jgi:hypothetical protein
MSKRFPKRFGNDDAYDVVPVVSVDDLVQTFEHPSCFLPCPSLPPVSAISPFFLFELPSLSPCSIIPSDFVLLATKGVIVK